jgi:hypothetical protein
MPTAEPACAQSAQRRHGKTPGVTKAIEHPLKTQSLRGVGKFLATVTLVQVKTGLVPIGNAQAQFPGVFAQQQVGGRRIATPTQPALDLRQSFERTAAGIGALIDFAQARLCQQSVGQHAFPTLSAAGQKLRHQRVAITVNDQTR